MLFKQEFERSKRYNNALSFLIFDIDDFKVVNDTYGHDVGDEILKFIATNVKNIIRNTDIFARWGGEEFVVLMPQTPIEGAYKIAEKIRSTIHQESRKSNLPHITCSFGISVMKQNEDEHEIFKKADESLYKAKQSGKNKTVISD